MPGAWAAAGAAPLYRREAGGKPPWGRPPGLGGQRVALTPGRRRRCPGAVPAAPGSGRPRPAFPAGLGVSATSVCVRTEERNGFSRVLVCVLFLSSPLFLWSEIPQRCGVRWCHEIAFVSGIIFFSSGWWKSGVSGLPSVGQEKGVPVLCPSPSAVKVFAWLCPAEQSRVAECWFPQLRF